MVSAAAKLSQHFACVRGIEWLSEDFTVQLDTGIRAQDEGVMRAGANLRGSCSRLCFREARNHCIRGLAGKFRLIDLSRVNFKRNSRIAQDFRTARRG